MARHHHLHHYTAVEFNYYFSIHHLMGINCAESAAFLLQCQRRVCCFGKVITTIITISPFVNCLSLLNVLMCVCVCVEQRMMPHYH